MDLGAGTHAGNASEGVQRAIILAVQSVLGKAGGDPEDLVNTTTELVPLPVADDHLDRLVARASAEGARAPIVRLGNDLVFGLLVSARHVWDLADRVQDLEAALAAVLREQARRPDGRRSLEALLTEIGVDKP